MIGQTLGPYEIVAKAGEGGMGEVYKARDTRLDRSVAIKILPEALAADSEFRERFNREARVISQFDHPNICTLYDVGEQVRPGNNAQAQPISYLVMQYLDGETLAARLATGPLPLDQALAIAMQVADALDRAHRHGIVHRDLKPGNIMLTKSGTKLLDFGLAKSGGLATIGTARVMPQGSVLPTTPPNLTAQGMILGTFQYMAPEQIEGAEADARSDIFAFGAVLYEMVTGKPAFTGKSQASLMASILSSEPMPIAELVPVAPPLLDRVVKRCLAKEPDDRWQSVRDIRTALAWIADGVVAAGASSASPVPGPHTGRRHRVTTAAIGLVAGLTIAGAASWILMSRRDAPDVQLIHLQVPAPESVQWDGAEVAVSPDGETIAFIGGRGPARDFAMWTRRLDASLPRKLAGTEYARTPFWSPDGRWIGFFGGSDGKKIQKIDVATGAVETIGDRPEGTFIAGATWSANGTILFAGGAERGLYRITANGGTPTPVTTLDRAHDESLHSWPVFLPDGTHYIFQLFGRDNAGLYLGSLESTEKTRLVAQDILDMTSVVYTPGYLLYTHKGNLVAHPFDAAARKLTGEPIRLAEGFGSGGPGYGGFGASQNGVLAYRPLLDSGLDQPTWFDRKGQALGHIGSTGNYASFALSPDDQTLAIDRITSMGVAVWLVDVARGTMTRFSGEPYGGAPIWSPDGNSIVYSSARDTPPNLFEQKLNGDEQRLVHLPVQTMATSWSRDGWVVYTARGSDTRSDIWAIDMPKHSQPHAILNTRFNEEGGRVSPDGNWLAFVSDDTGQPEVYVTSFPDAGRRIRVSTNGGRNPRWRADGRELFFASQGMVTAVAMTNVNGAAQPGAPTTLFKMPNGNQFFQPSADGQRFLINVETAPPPQLPIEVIVNWTKTIRR